MPAERSLLSRPVHAQPPTVGTGRVFLDSPSLVDQMWLNPPTTISTLQPERECSASASSSPAKPLESEPLLWAVVSGKPVQRPRSWRSWRTRKAAASLFGTICNPSSAGASADWNEWMRSRRATRASHSAPLASALANGILATFGRRFVESSREQNPASCSLRTSTDTSLSVSGKSCEISKGLATALRRACSARRKWARRMVENECSSLGWQTANAADAKRDYQRDGMQAGNERDALSGQAKNWATPNCLESACRVGFRTQTKGGRELATDSMNFATPRGSDGSNGGLNQRGSKGDQMLPSEAANWATPNTARRGAESLETKANRSGGGMKELLVEVTNWPTPNANPDAPNNSTTREGGREAARLTNQCMGDIAKNWPTTTSRDWKVGDLPTECRVGSEALTAAAESFPPAEPSTDDRLSLLLTAWTRPASPRLSPAFQWWLMGWPHPRTFFGSAATESCHCKRHGRSCSCSRALWTEWYAANKAALSRLCHAFAEAV